MISGIELLGITTGMEEDGCRMGAVGEVEMWN